MEATVLLSIYLSSELYKRVPSARCPLADVPGSACETPSPRRHLATLEVDLEDPQLHEEDQEKTLVRFRYFAHRGPLIRLGRGNDPGSDPRSDRLLRS